MSQALWRPLGRGIEGERRAPSRPSAHELHARSNILLPFEEGDLERETGLEPATFCLGSRHSAS